MVSRYTIQVREPDGTLLHVLSRYQSARYRLAENEVGEFEVTVPWLDDEIPMLLSPPNHIEFWRDGTWVCGGIIRRQNIRQEGRVPFYTVSGPNYMQWLADVRIRPVTGTADVTYSLDELDNMMKFIVTTQVIDFDTRFSVDPYTSSSTVADVYTATAYQTVLEVLEGIATLAGDTTFDIVREDNELVFKTWTPSRGPDKSLGTSSPVLFDMRGGNLLNAEWNRDGNAVVNALWGGGPGEKAARFVWPDTEALVDAVSIGTWGRIEGFIDAGVATTLEVPEKVQEELTKSANGEESVSFQIANFGRYTLGDDFDFGTKVTVVWAPLIEFSDTIRGIEVRLDSGSGVASVDINVGDTITGDAQTRASMYLGRYLRSLKRTISVQTRH